MNMAKKQQDLKEELKNLEGSRIINDDLDLGDEKSRDDNNPFKELRHLISDQQIDVKSILTDKQITVNHKLNTLQNLFEMESGSEEAQKCAQMLKHFSNRYMTLVINKDGLSRRQFIEALHRGGDRAEEARRFRLEDGFLKVG
jgi:hypothetical protein